MIKGQRDICISVKIFQGLGVKSRFADVNGIFVTDAQVGPVLSLNTCMEKSRDFKVIGSDWKHRQGWPIPKAEHPRADFGLFSSW